MYDFRELEAYLGNVGPNLKLDYKDAFELD